MNAITFPAIQNLKAVPAPVVASLPIVTADAVTMIYHATGYCTTKFTTFVVVLLHKFFNLLKSIG